MIGDNGNGCNGGFEFACIEFGARERVGIDDRVIKEKSEGSEVEFGVFAKEPLKKIRRDDGARDHLGHDLYHGIGFCVAANHNTYAGRAVRQGIRSVAKVNRLWEAFLKDGCYVCAC